MRVAIYSRVSTTQQDDEAQYEELAELCKRSGWQVARIYREKLSGTKSAAERPELKRLLIEANGIAKAKERGVRFGPTTNIEEAAAGGVGPERVGAGHQQDRSAIARRHRVSSQNVAIGWLLNKPREPGSLTRA